MSIRLGSTARSIDDTRELTSLEAYRHTIEPETHMANGTTTGARAASQASRTLASGSTGARSKTAAASALAQTGAPGKTTSRAAASAASAVLRDGRTSDASKSAAASALAQAKKASGR